MYNKSKKQWNPYAGCNHDCKYCKKSFQANLKRWAKKNCTPCYNFEPHEHAERLNQFLPKTKAGEFIFTCASGDIAFCSIEFLNRILEVIRKYSDRTFLIQSKDPSTFNRVTFPDNVILGVTLETNRDFYNTEVSPGAPTPSQRYNDFLVIDHPRKMVTIEPVMKNDIDILTEWIISLNPEVVWLGLDSKKCGLPEPTPYEFYQLYDELTSLGFDVMLKTEPEDRK